MAKQAAEDPRIFHLVVEPTMKFVKNKGKQLEHICSIPTALTRSVLDRRDMTMTSTDEEDNNTSSLCNVEFDQIANVRNACESHDKKDLEIGSSTDLDVDSNQSQIELHLRACWVQFSCLPKRSIG